MQRTTLGEALGITAADDLYYAFRDISTGLEYLRNGAELSEKGLYAELGEYEFSVFMDFREIQDDAEGTWSMLCGTLDGNGVENLEDERLQVLYKPLNKAFRDVLENVSAESGAAVGGAVPVDEDMIDKTADVFEKLLIKQKKTVLKRSSVSKKWLSQSLKSVAQALVSPSKIKSDAGVSSALPAEMGKVENQLIAAWLLLQEEPHALTLYGLDYTFRKLTEQNPEYLLSGAGYVQLLQALLAAGADTVAQPVFAPLEKILALPACQEFILVHESEGQEWFHKERFELLLQWLVMIRLTAFAEEPPAVGLGKWVQIAASDVQHFTELAAHSGYRLDLFLRLLRSAEKSAEGTLSAVSVVNRPVKVKSSKARN